jgi:alkanesulfonate monooxygenase SsuD/methylene tetrahydromethanopterin reductase-like flavin-dependent oxidoreductase (luciferase family)
MIANKIKNMSGGIEFGVLLHTRHLIRNEGLGPSFEAIWEEAALAERLGMDQVWVGDSVTVLDRARGDCLTLMASLAMKTHRVKVGTVPLLPALRSPVLLAHTLATLDVISQGRVLIGASVAPSLPYIQHQFEACGVPYSEKAGRLSESIQIMKRLWTEKTVSFEGKYHKLKDVGILPHPVQQPSIPVWVTADRNENAFKRVARLADGWFTSGSRPVEKFAINRNKIQAYAESYGRRNWDLPSGIYATFNLNTKREKAMEEGWKWAVDFFRQPKTNLDHLFTIFGTPDDCVQLLQAYIDAGLTVIVARLASSDVESQMRLLIEEVKPRLIPRVV